MEIIASNISGEIRQEKLMGNEYIVVPMTMIVEGVLNGSMGPYYYPSDTITKDPEVWNYMPIVLNHPQDADGRYISARFPSVLEKHGLGFVFNAGSDENRLFSEAWFDKVRVTNVAPDLLKPLLNKEKVELSTGLLKASLDDNKGVFNSKEYVGSVLSYVPDHLAILPKQKGACSVDDGCGLYNEEKINNEGIIDKIKNLLGMESKKEKSVNQIMDELVDLVKTDGEYTWVVDLYSDYFIYSTDQDYYKQGYTMSDSGEVSLTGESTKVERKVVYNSEDEPLWSSRDSELSEGGPQMPLSKDDRKKLIDTIIGNCSCEKDKEPVFNEKDRETLDGFTDAQLERLAATNTKGTKEGEEEPSKKPPVTNSELNNREGQDTPKVKTEEEWLKDPSIPHSIRESVANTLKRENAYKETLVKRIEESDNCRLTNELLMSKPIDELEAIVELMAPSNKEEEGGFMGAGSFPNGVIPVNQKQKKLNQETRMTDPAAIWANSRPQAAKN